MDRSKDVAIIGMGATLPGALDVPTFWADQLAGRHHVRTLPREVWDASRLVDPTRGDADRPYTGIGAVVRGMRFDPRDFGLPPRVARDLDPCQKAALVTARQALADAGIEGPTSGLRAAVILGNVLGGSQMRGEGWFRVQQPLLEATLAGLPRFRALPAAEREGLIEELRAHWHAQYPSISGDSLPGLLGNVIAARIAHFYNFRGPTVTVDAACASSLLAIEQAVLGLRAGRYDLAVTGGVDFQMDAPTYVGFCAMGALSPDGSFPFDERANGFVMGEGAAVFVLKRLEDAERDRDFVHAVIHGVASASDGRGKALVAPSVKGQIRTIREAWLDAGLSPSTLGYVEAHGTATPIGDPTEVLAMSDVFGDLPRGSVPLGSAKANVGHLKGAAGAVGLLRAVLALREGVVPPLASFERPNPRCRLEASPVRVPRAPEAFPAGKSTAAVSAFGFGGINGHVVVGRPDGARAASSARVRAPRAASAPPLGLGIVALGASTREELASTARSLLPRAADPRTLARELAAGPSPRLERHRAAFFAETPERARAALETLVAYLEGAASEKRLEAAGVVVCSGAPPDRDAVALMFPGQGSQYVGMLGDLAARFPVVRETLDEADAVTADLLPRALSSYLAPPDGESEAEAFFALCQTEVLQPAMLAADEAIRRLLAPLFAPRVVLGHSLGEYGACIAADVLDFADALRIVAVRGEATSRVPFTDKGKMLGVAADEATVRAFLDPSEGYADVVNKNCASQTIVGGETAAVEALDRRLRAKGLQTIFLPVSHAFHSRIVAGVSPLLREVLDTVDVRGPRVPILSNVTADYYPEGEGAPDRIRALLADQVACPVEFIAMIERAYADGARVFVEVGPKRAQAGFVSDILRGRPHRSVHVCHAKLGEVETLGRALAALVAEGVVAYGDPRRTRAAGDAIEWRPPFVPAAHGTPIVAAPVSDAQVAPAVSVAQAAAVTTAPAPATFAALEDVARDPRFWQFVAAQAPALSAFVAATFRTAVSLDGAAPSAASATSATFAAPAPAVASAPPASAVATAASATIAPPPSTPAAPAVQALDVVAAPPSPAHFEGDAGVATLPRDRRALEVWLVDRVAEHTGYRHEELSLDADLESELGIDSIRQIEVVLGVRDALGLAPDDEFRRSDHRTLRSLVDYLATRAGLGAGEELPVRADAPAPAASSIAPPPAPSIPAPAIAPEHAGASVQGRDLTAWVLSRVAEKTGYAEHELPLDADLESELGVDSIRQIEIVLDVRDALGLPPDEHFRMSDYPTLRALVSYVEKRLAERDRPSVSSPAATTAQANGAEAPQALPFADARPAEAAPGVASTLPAPYYARKVQLEPAPPVGRRAARGPVLVLHRGAPAALLEALGGSSVELRTDVDEPSLAATLREHGPRTIVDLSALAEPEDAPVDAAAAALRRVFRLGRAMLATSPAIERVLVATHIDGALGWKGPSAEGDAALARHAAGGAAAGAWKSFAREWADTGRTPFDLTVIDCEAGVAPAALAAELAGAGTTEVALPRGERLAPVLREAPFAGSPLPDDAVVVALGGGRGITARLVGAIARPGRRLVVVGRTAHRPELASLDAAGARAEARRALGESAPSREVNAHAAELGRAAELARTLESLRAVFASVDYLEADATRTSDVATALVGARRLHGRIDLVLHGAGVDRSRAIEAKTESELDAVLSPKLAPVAALDAHSAGARWVVLSSVAARFGNAGQIDYAAANEALAKAALARGGLVLDYSAWADVGMAAPLARALRERGVDLLEPDATAAWTAAAIDAGATGEWVIAGRLPAGRLPVLDATITALVPGASSVSEAPLELERQAFLRDHRVRTSGLLPGVVALAALEQAARTLEPSLAVASLRDVELAQPLKVFPGKRVDVVVRADRGESDDRGLEVAASTWTGDDLHHRAVVRLACDSPEPPSPEWEAPDERGPDAVALYKTFFHGPSFQVVAATSVRDDVALGRSPALDLPLGADLPEEARCTALARELALQTCGAHMLVSSRELALPVGVGALEIHERPRDGEVVEALARARGADATHRTYDVVTRGEDGRILETLRGVRFRLLAKIG